VKGPGARFFEALRVALGELPIVAENLGVITPEVEELRERFSLPGMAILQFAFGGDGSAETFKPHNFVRNLVAYTGTHATHDQGWWTAAGVRKPEEAGRSATTASAIWPATAETSTGHDPCALASVPTPRWCRCRTFWGSGTRPA
jgi:4-alpha-glucanotransferase